MMRGAHGDADQTPRVGRAVTPMLDNVPSGAAVRRMLRVSAGIPLRPEIRLGVEP